MIRTFEVPKKYIDKFHEAYARIKFHEFRLNKIGGYLGQKDYADCFGKLAGAFGDVLELRYSTLNRTTNTIEQDLDTRKETRFFFHQMGTVICYLRTKGRKPKFISESMVALENYLTQIHVFMDTLFFSSYSLHAHFDEKSYGKEKWIWRTYELDENTKKFELSFRSIDNEIKVCEYEIKRWGKCFDLDMKLGEEIEKLKRRKLTGK